ncbi:hypothetical protein D6779_04145 [Candidatus Parcubacteria bacterium]|nr:MAG: hypothetical protein D6779_04145 [Candidatus Parcubacteria bacterium]
MNRNRGAGNKKVRNLRRGQGALAFTFLVGSIALVVAVTLAFLAASFATTSFGFQAANRAFSAAQSGAEDGILHLVRDSQFSHSGYTVTIDGVDVQVVVENDGNGHATSTGTATVGFYRRKVVITAAIDRDSGTVTVVATQLSL